MVYRFDHPRSNASYIGKSERCLITRLEEHSEGNSQIYSHMYSCEPFQDYKDLLDNLPLSRLYSTIILNTKVIDASDSWNVLMFKGALAIRRKQWWKVSK